MAFMADTSNSNPAENKSPLFHTANANNVFRSPLMFGANAAADSIKKRELEGVDTLEDDDTYLGNAISTGTLSSSPLVTPKTPKTRSPYRPHIRTSSPIPPTTTRASASRPLYQDRSSPVVPLKDANRSSQGTPTKRQLMPSIPTRKDSANSVEGLGARSKSSTNIQTLAQAIAARAQHVAAANALAKANINNTDNPALDVFPVAHTDSDGLMLNTSSSSSISATAAAAAVAEAGRTSPSGSMPRSVSTSNSEADRRASALVHQEEEKLVQSESGILGHSHLAAKQFNEQMSRDSMYSNDSSRWSKSGWNAVQEPETIERGTDEVDADETTNGKHKTSDSDHSISTGPTSHGEHRQSNMINTGNVPINGQRRGSAKSRTSSGSHDMTSEGAHGKLRSSVAGLGIVDVAAMSSPPSSIVKGMNSSSLDGYATAPDANSSMTNYSLSNATDLPFPTSPNSDGLYPSSSLSRPRRKSRPNGLTLNLLASPKAGASTSINRMLASPSKTPPPTMPPSEPLPPVPPTSSNVYQRASTISSRLSSPRNSGLDSSSPLIAAFAAMASSNKNRLRQESDPSPKRLQFDEGSSSPQHRSTQSTSAMVSANHATTLAGAENAQAVLNQVAVEPSFNEKRASMKLLAKEAKEDLGSRSPKRSSDPTVAMPRRSLSDVGSKGQLASTTVIMEDATRINEEDEELMTSRAPSSAQDDSNASELLYSRRSSQEDGKKVEREEQEEESPGEEEGEEEEAILTKVTSISGNLAALASGTPRLIRTESASTLQMDKEVDSEIAVISTAPPRNVVGRVRAQIETRGSTGEKEILVNSRKLSTGPPSAWNSRQVEKATTTAIAADSGSNQQNSTETSTPLAATPSELQHSGNAPGAWSVQSRRSEKNDDLSSSSPVDGFGRLKRTEGRFAGAFGEISLAFKQLQAEKKVLERVIRATTPLAGVGNGEDLGQYLTSLSSKLALSTAEIRQLLDLLDQQRSIMDYMVETHQLESEAYQDEINDLKDDLDVVETEAQTHRMNCIKLTETLDQTHQDLFDTREETRKTKSNLEEEVKKREMLTQLLRSARGEMIRMEEERAKAVQAKNEGEEAHSNTRTALENAHAEHAAELQSQKETLEVALYSLQAHKSGSVTPIPREAEHLAMNSDAATIANLQRQLEESKKSQTESERQLQELRLSTTSKGIDEVSIGSLSPLITGSSFEVEEALRDKLVQQEQDIAELRAAVALGAGVGGTKEEQLALLPAGRANQVEKLLADLAEKRTREAQIRSAYKQLRDEMRKLQLSQQQDRRRSQASFTYLANSGATGSSTSSHGHGVVPPSSYFSAISMDSSAPSTPEGNSKEGTTVPTSRALKRLSLPLVSMQYAGASLMGNTMSSGGTRNVASPSALARMSTDGHSNLKYQAIGGEEVEEVVNSTSPEEQIERLITPSPSTT